MENMTIEELQAYVEQLKIDCDNWREIYENSESKQIRKENEQTYIRAKVLYESASTLLNARLSNEQKSRYESMSIEELEQEISDLENDNEYNLEIINGNKNEKGQPDAWNDYKDNNDRLAKAYMALEAKKSGRNR